MYCGIRYAIPGMIEVASSTMNAASRPANFSRANAYPAIDATIRMPITFSPASFTLFQRNTGIRSNTCR